MRIALKINLFTVKLNKFKYNMFISNNSNILKI